MLGVVAAAAAVLLTVGIGSRMAKMTADQATAGSQAQGTVNEEEGIAVVQGHEGYASRDSVSATAVDASSGVTPDDAIAPQEQPTTEEMPAAEDSLPPGEAQSQLPREVSTPAARRSGASETGDLRAWTDEANNLWKRGDLAGATHRFEQIARAGRRTMLGELAWGDLFAIDRNIGDASRMIRRWKAYLRRFPRGRFADDARAGLCRVSTHGKACRDADLRDFAAGFYRHEAEQASDGT